MARPVNKLVAAVEEGLRALRDGRKLRTVTVTTQRPPKYKDAPSRRLSARSERFRTPSPIQSERLLRLIPNGHSE